MGAIIIVCIFFFAALIKVLVEDTGNVLKK